MYKKIIALLLCMTAIFSLCSCTKKDNNSEVFDPDAPKTTSADSTVNENDPDAVKVTVPEGYTALRIAWLLEEKGVCTTEQFMNAMQNYDVSKYPTVKEIQNVDNLCFKLEGYLFPATYVFKKNEDPNKVIDEMLRAFEKRFSDEFKQKAQQMGYSVHKIMTIASIIEKEAFSDEQKYLVSSTIYNRINKNMKLQYDVILNYCEKVIREYYPNDYIKYFEHYSYKRTSEMLPGPICNPGIGSIQAALNPAETDYLYFIIDTKEPHNAAFAATYEEHQANIVKWKNGEL